jgi:hypothetical protein
MAAKTSSEAAGVTMSNVIHAISNVGRTAVGTGEPSDAAQIVLATWSRVGVTDLRGIASDLAKVAEGDCGRAAQLLADIKPQLTPADQQRLANEFVEAFNARAPTASPQRSNECDPKPSAAASGNASLALDGIQIGLSIAGIFDPTPTCDAIDGLISLLRGDYAGAGISALGMIPYLGDAAKLGKLGRVAETAGQAVDLAQSNAPFPGCVPPTLDKINDALRAAPSGILPASANPVVHGVRETLAGFPSMVDASSGSKVARALGSADQTVDVLPNFRRSGYFTAEAPVTLGYSQHIARGEMNACSSGACATTVSILERGHAFPKRIPNLFYEVDAQLATVASRSGRSQPNIEDIQKVLQLRGFDATLHDATKLADLLNASKQGPVVFAIRTDGALDHALVVHSIEVTKAGKGAPELFRLFNPDEYSPLASGMYDRGELIQALGTAFAGYMLTTR